MPGNVQFEEDTQFAVPKLEQRFMQTHPSFTTRLVTRLSGGVIESERYAAVILIIVAIVLSGIAIYNYMNAGTIEVPDSARAHNNGKSLPAGSFSQKNNEH
jgi:hypothetical protein